MERERGAAGEAARHAAASTTAATTAATALLQALLAVRIEDGALVLCARTATHGRGDYTT